MSKSSIADGLERVVGLTALVLADELQRIGIGRRRSFGLLELPVLPALEGRDRNDNARSQRDDVIAIAVPQFLELFLADFFVDFPEQRFIAHASIPSNRLNYWRGG